MDYFKNFLSSNTELHCLVPLFSFLGLIACKRLLVVFMIDFEGINLILGRMEGGFVKLIRLGSGV
jgi:hypothetical protein